MARALARGIIEVPSSAEAHAALDSLNVRLKRVESADESVRQSRLDGISRAHFVRYGAALLSSPLTQTSTSKHFDYAELKLATNALCEWLQQLKLKPRRVYSLEDFDSQILARALAQQFEIDCEVADGDGFTHSKALIVGSDSRQFTASPLRTVFPGQVLYAFNLHRETGTIAPDVSGLTHPEFTFPWQGERLTARKIGAFADRINEVPMAQPSEDWPLRLEFYRSRRALLTAGSSSYSRSLMLPELAC